MQTASLWDVEDAEIMPAVRDMTVGPVSAADLREFARRYHYTRAAGNSTWRFGLWHSAMLLGVIGYNLPTEETRASVFGEAYAQHVWHMGRLILADDAPRNSESRLIGGSLREIRRGHPDVWGILTYAAIDAGHLGYVYQATNAIYTGLGGHSVFFIDQDGKRWSDQLNRCRVRTAAEREAAGWVTHRGELKHRYVYVLGSRTERRRRLALLKLPQLAYPKTSAASADVSPAAPSQSARPPPPPAQSQPSTPICGSTPAAPAPDHA